MQKKKFFTFPGQLSSYKSVTNFVKNVSLTPPPELAMGPRRVKLWSQIDIRSNYLYMEFRSLVLIFRGSKSVKTSYDDARGTIPLIGNIGSCPSIPHFWYI